MYCSIQVLRVSLHHQTTNKKKNKIMKSTVAQCAAAIRSELKSTFPGVKFSVTSESFSMGNAVRISYTDGPIKDAVEDVVAKYQYGSFNSMEDLYEYSNVIDDLPQAKYITISREMSPETKSAIMAEMGITPDQYNDYNEETGKYNYESVSIRFWSMSFCAQPEQKNKVQTQEQPEPEPVTMQVNEPETSEGVNTAVYRQVLTAKRQEGVNIPTGQIHKSEDAANIARMFWDADSLPITESAYALYLNVSNKPIAWALISAGAISSTPIDTRIVIGHAILSCASGMILFHNHPSGDLKPSISDIETTRQISAAAELMGIKMIDHIILSGLGPEHYSLVSENVL